MVLYCLLGTMLHLALVPLRAQGVIVRLPLPHLGMVLLGSSVWGVLVVVAPVLIVILLRSVMSCPSTLGFSLSIVVRL